MQKMEYDFDTVLDRSGTGSLKWEKYAGSDVLPLWVADMDFVSAPEIIEALQKRLDHGVMGYTLPPQDTTDAALAYLKNKHGYDAKPEWLFWMHGMVPGLNVAARAFGETGDEILTCTPIYPPFLSAPVWQERKSGTSHLQWDGKRWTFDFDDLEAKVTPRSRTFYLCNPHNPVGRVYDRDELIKLAEFCERHDLVLLSDEIHCDLILNDVKHICTATLSKEIDERTITFMAPSKTYNVPGLACAFAVIRNPQIRAKFKNAARGLITEVNPFGYAGCAAAYELGEPWRQALLGYLRENRDYLYQFITERIPEIKLHPMEATYLAWLNIEGLLTIGIDNPHQFFVDAGVGLSPGKDFADGNYLRLNFGCPRSILETALERMEKAVSAERIPQTV
ncbi:PatB family C-S lyase [Rubellicoccus peritrichatus]|uniref:cysteine-S-conjugate beta-lyase n=1 Tax=Rubellicoccus peritrichatus TaxID=3080537 RepID=A0AAQ3L742_9BACT|nr:PatB family C-S lyase [Puniceicoccus sp. CR14]WOO39867.1 PatB family C-S lyase [Puniceicoccus sp. CR14]